MQTTDDYTQNYEAIPYNFAEGEDRARNMDDTALRYTLEDLRQVIAVGEAEFRAGNPYPKLGYYYDERHTIVAEIRRRETLNN